MSTNSDTDTAKAVLMQPCKHCYIFPQTDQNFFTAALKVVSLSYWPPYTSEDTDQETR